MSLSDLGSGFKRHKLSVVLFFIPLSLFVYSFLVLHLPEPYQAILLTVTAVMGIHVLDRLFLIKDTEEALATLVRDIRGDVTEQTRLLIST